MKILIVHNHNRLTGVSTFLYTFSKELIKKRIKVTFWIKKNEDLDLILNSQLEKLGVKVVVDKKIPDEFDQIFFSYNDTFKLFKHYSGVKKFFVHGLMDKLYLPPIEGVDKVIVFGERALYHVNTKIDKVLIRNFIDTGSYSCNNRLNNKLKNILILDSRTNNFVLGLISAAASEIGAYVSFVGQSQYGNKNKWDIAEQIKDADLVIAYGRSAIEAMSCGKAVMIYGVHGGDGYLTSGKLKSFMETNLSGWSTGQSGKNCSKTKKLKPPYEEEMKNIINEFNKYSSEDGIINRRLAVSYFDSSIYIDTLLK